MARSMLSEGMFTALAAWVAVRRRGLPAGSPPPTRAATVISRMILVKTRPRWASTFAFLCLMPAHLLCPDMIAPPTWLLAPSDGQGENYHSGANLAKGKLPAGSGGPFGLPHFLEPRGTVRLAGSRWQRISARS